MLPYTPDPASFGSKRFFGNLVPNRSCVPNLKLLASTVAKTSMGPNFLDAPLAVSPFNFVLNVAFGKQHFVPK